MAKYHVNQYALEDVDCSILIEAVARYLSAEHCKPSIDVIMAILGIERIEEKVCTTKD